MSLVREEIGTAGYGLAVRGRGSVRCGKERNVRLWIIGARCKSCAKRNNRKTKCGCREVCRSGNSPVSTAVFR